MTVDEMRKRLSGFCQIRDCNEDPCEDCPIDNLDNVCEDYNWYNAPEALIKKAYWMLFGDAISCLKELKTKGDDAE